MSLHHTTYEVETTLYLRTPRPAGGYFILWEQDITVTVSEESDEGSLRPRVEAIDFGLCELDRIPLQDDQRLRENCELFRPSQADRQAAIHNDKTAIAKILQWDLLCSCLDDGHIQDCVADQKSAPQGIPGRKGADA